MRLHRPVPHHHQPHLAPGLPTRFDDGGEVNPGALLGDSGANQGGTYSIPFTPVDQPKALPDQPDAMYNSSGGTPGVPAPITDKAGPDNSKDQTALVQHAQNVYSTVQSALEKAYNDSLKAYGGGGRGPQATNEVSKPAPDITVQDQDIG